MLNKLGGRFGYFLFFSVRGRGRGSPSRERRGGVRFLLKIPGGGGGFSGQMRVGGRVAGRVFAGNWGGGLNIFFFGAEIPTKQSNTIWCRLEAQLSGTGRIRFRRVRFQTPNSVSFSGLTEFRGANSVSFFQPIICV